MKQEKSVFYHKKSGQVLLITGIEQTSKADFFTLQYSIIFLEDEKIKNYPPQTIHFTNWGNGQFFAYVESQAIILKKTKAGLQICESFTAI